MYENKTNMPLATPSKKPEVTSALDELKQSLSILEVSIDQLHSKLSPILRASEKIDEAPKEAINLGKTEIAHEIFCIAQRVNNLSDITVSLINRSEI
jgi:hypothetical protein